MLPRSNPRRRWSADHHARSCFQASTLPSTEGFSLLEGLVAAAVVIVAMVGTVSAFNLITSSLGKTTAINAQNIAIDQDIARVKRLALDYTSCVDPAGSVPATGSCDVLQNQASYYFPKSTSKAEQDKFFAACTSATSSSHITAGFIAAIDNLSSPGASVVRMPAQREAGSDPKNHNVLIDYQLSGKSVRLIIVAPVVSAWCG